MDEDTGAGVFVRLIHDGTGEPTLSVDAADPNVVLCQNKSGSMRVPVTTRRTRRRPGAASASSSSTSAVPPKRYSFADVFTTADSTITLYEQCIHPLVHAGVGARYDGLFVELMASSTQPDRNVLLNYTTKTILESIKTQMCTRGTFHLDQNEKFQTSQTRLQQSNPIITPCESTPNSFFVAPEKDRRYSLFFSQMETSGCEEVYDSLLTSRRLYANKKVISQPVIKNGIVKGVRAVEICSIDDLTGALEKTQVARASCDLVSILRIVSIDSKTRQLEQCHISFVRLASERFDAMVPVLQQAFEARVGGYRYAAPTDLGATCNIMRMFLDGRGQIACLVNADTAPQDQESLVRILSTLSCEGTGMQRATPTRERTLVPEPGKDETEVVEGEEVPNNNKPSAPPAYNHCYPQVHFDYPRIEHLTLRKDNARPTSVSCVSTPIAAPIATSSASTACNEDLEKVDSFLTHEERQLTQEARIIEAEAIRLKKKQDLLNVAKIDREKRVIAQMIEEIKDLKRERMEQQALISKMGGELTAISAENTRFKERELRSAERNRLLESDLLAAKEKISIVRAELRVEHEQEIVRIEELKAEELRLKMIEYDKKLEAEKDIWLQEVETGVAEQLKQMQDQLQAESDGKAKLISMVQDLARCVSNDEQAKTALELVRVMRDPEPRQLRNGKSIYLRGQLKVLSHAGQNELVTDTETIFGPKLRNNTVHTTTPQKNEVKKSDLYVLANRTEKDGVAVTQLFKGDVTKSVSGKGRSVHFTGMEERSETLPLHAPPTDKTNLVAFSKVSMTKGRALVESVRQTVAKDAHVVTATRKRQVDDDDDSDGDEERALIGDSAYEKLRRQRRCAIQIEGSNLTKTARSRRQISGDTRRKYTKLA